MDLQKPPQDGRAAPPPGEAPFLSVVLSFYNEEEVLPELISRLRSTLRPLCGRRYELLFVDDDSTDRSLEILRAEAAAEGDIRVIVMARNVGPSICAVEGIRQSRGEGVVYMDSDLQDPPELIPRMVEAWKAEPGIEVVHTQRDSRKGETLFKLFVTRIGYAFLRSVSTVPIIPEAGDFKLLSRRAVQEICRCSERKPFPRGLAIWLGFRQAIVRYTREGRRAGRSKCPVLGRRVRDYFLDTALVSFSEAPLKLALYAGLFITAAASLGLLGLVAGKAMGLPAAAGWSPVLLVAVTFLGGFQLLASGILGLYVNAVHGEVRRRPPFVIRERIGFGEDGPAPLPGGPSATR